MADGTKIEWTRGEDGTEGASWNPLMAIDKTTGKRGWHCVHASDGCKNCYAETLNGRLGTGRAYAAQETRNVEVRLNTEGKGQSTLEWPIRAQRPRRIFVCSMTDLFGEWVTDEQIDQIFATMALAQQHTFLVLTKRAKRMHEYFTAEGPGPLGSYDAPDRIQHEMDVRCGHAGLSWPLPNVWLGVSAEDQKTADERIPHLLATPAAVRWISYEPALGPVRLFQFPAGRACTRAGEWLKDGEVCQECKDNMGIASGIDWVVVGGESGPGARPFSVDWAADTIKECGKKGVAVFVKQIGGNPYIGDPEKVHQKIATKDKKGGDPEEWMPYLRVREYPKGAAA